MRGRICACFPVQRLEAVAPTATLNACGSLFALNASTACWVYVWVEWYCAASAITFHTSYYPAEKTQEQQEQRHKKEMRERVMRADHAVFVWRMICLCLCRKKNTQLPLSMCATGGCPCPETLLQNNNFLPITDVAGVTLGMIVVAVIIMLVIIGMMMMVNLLSTRKMVIIVVFGRRGWRCGVCGIILLQDVGDWQEFGWSWRWSWSFSVRQVLVMVIIMMMIL